MTKKNWPCTQNNEKKIQYWAASVHFNWFPSQSSKVNKVFSFYILTANWYFIPSTAYAEGKCALALYVERKKNPRYGLQPFATEVDWKKATRWLYVQYAIMQTEWFPIVPDDFHLPPIKLSIESGNERNAHTIEINYSEEKKGNEKKKAIAIDVHKCALHTHFIAFEWLVAILFFLWNANSLWQIRLNRFNTFKQAAK